jgi:CrcB protein
MTLFVASMAGAIGAVARYLISGWIQDAQPSDFPVGTLMVNLIGSLGLGLLVGSPAIDSPLGLGAVGFLGGFTTFSTWMIETIRLGYRSPQALLNLFLSIFGGLAAALIGLSLTT